MADPKRFDLSRRLFSEGLGTMFLVAAVVGSGIMGEQLALQRSLPWREFLAYIPVQILGGIAGAILAHIMFDLPLIPVNHAALSDIFSIKTLIA